MKNDIPYFFLDWDYETFCFRDDGTFNLYDDEIYLDRPEYIYLEGFIAPGYKYLKLTLAKLIDDERMTYKLVESD